MKCEDQQHCDFSHAVINRPCRFGSRCYKFLEGSCLFLHENPRHGNIPEERQSWDRMNNGRGSAGGSYFESHGIDTWNSNQHFNNNDRNWRWNGNNDYRGDSLPVGGRGVAHQMLDPGVSRRYWESDRNVNFLNKLCREGGSCPHKSTTCSFNHKPVQKQCRHGSQCNAMFICSLKHRFE